MADDYTAKMLELASRRKQMLDNGESLLKTKRIELGIEQYFDIFVLTDPEVRERAKAVLAKYLDHLLVERNFYMEYHRTFLEESTEIAQILTTAERERLWPRTATGLEDNNKIRIRINEIKVLTAAQLQQLIAIYDLNTVTVSNDGDYIGLESDEDIEKVQRIFDEIDDLDKEGLALVKLQKKRSVDGRNFMARFLTMLRDL